MFRDPRRGSLV